MSTSAVKDIEFSDEQAMLLETAMDFCATRAPIAKVREMMESAEPMDQELWQAMVDLGWLAIAIPENHGGLGLGLGAVVPVMESMGRQLWASPFMSTTLAAYALTCSDNEALQGQWLPKLASGAIATLALTEDSGDWDLTNLSATATRTGDRLQLAGTKTLVVDASVADLVLVSCQLDGKPVLVAVSDLPADRLTKETIIDETRRAFRIRLDGLEVPDNQVIAQNIFAEVELAAMLLLSAESAGGLQNVLNLIVGYLNERKAFDRFIGSYQALKHPTVDVLLGMEAARSHVYHAATIWDTATAAQKEEAVRIAKAQSGEAFAFAGDRAVQFHGGMGFTWECDAQLYLRRALWNQYQYGDERHQRALLAPLLLDAV